MTSRPRALAAALLTLGLAALGSDRAAAQHPLPPQTRPLHERFATAELVVLARIESVDVGRIAVVAERVFLGEAPARFEVKRAPSAPPPLGVGDRALLMLRGARSPYLMIDEPREVVRLVGEASAARWGEAFASLIEGRDDPGALASVYVGWLDEGPATLRKLAMRALMDPEASFQPLPDAVLYERARVALDPERPDEVRQAAAFLATGSPAATEKLLGGVPGDGGAADLAVTFAAFRGGVLHRSPSLDAALRRALRHPSPEMRRVALRTATVVPRGVAPSLADEIAALVEREPDEGIRAQAERTLGGFR